MIPQRVPPTPDAVGWTPNALGPSAASIISIVSTPYALGGMGIASVQRDFTVAEINALNVTPITLIAAPGIANVAIVPVAWSMHKKCTVNFSTNTTMGLVYAGEPAGNYLLGSVGLGLGGNPLERYIFNQASGASGSDSNNNVGTVVRKNTAVQLIANLANGGAPTPNVPLRVTVFYQLVALLV